MDFYDVFFVHDPDPVPSFWFLTMGDRFADGSCVDIWAYTQCRRVQNPKTVPIIIKERGEYADYNYVAVAGVPLISQRLAGLLSEVARDDVQLIPAQIDAPGNWYVANVLPRVDAINHERSIIHYRDNDNPHRPGEPRGVIRLVIDPDRVAGLDIFRLFGWNVALIVSQRIKERCECEGMTNMQFTSVTPSTSDDWKLKAVSRQIRPKT